MRNLLISLFLLFISLIVKAGEGQHCTATLDWTVAETLIALGEPPCAVGDVDGYKKWVVEPKLPDDVIDLGIRNQPNQEVIAYLSYSLRASNLVFINTSFYQATTPMLQKFDQIDAIHQVDFYQSGNAWQNIVDATQKVADFLNKPESAVQLMQEFSQKITALQPQTKAFTNRPVALVQFIDTRHLRIYGTNSPFGEVLRQLDFHNAWQGAVNDWGFETINITQLAKLPKNSRFVVVKPYPTNIATALTHNTLWQHLPMSENALVLPAIWTFGGIPSAQRFAESLVFALENGGEPW
ncbi:iron complex transport system substrate-binding protein [Cricetibacter osteomyelitidis]|uniref:Iron complex transport system substrate-binding protein n=1 Tax=Cricetibacter osteomyelitidis TaxID=1521931 RepID=A0A4R2T478_9PAST|nr:iron-siderophore ABC transporter substrate-binding protein [Cricetibacter osteomyelitidis]TCP97797.1 iron complex transport system substrate-binding protein [Cricetibacter osteomyelitidis]